MPRRNSIKHYAPGEIYHGYNRGVAKMNIFRDDSDYRFMLSMLKTYLSVEEISDSRGRVFPNYHDKLNLVAYCLMPNHFHMMFSLKKSDGIEKLMRSVMTRYSMYFNRKYNRTGSLFEGSFLAARVDSDAYFWHLSRYVHLNPIDLGVNYFDYPYSSIGYYLGDKTADWVHSEVVLQKGNEAEYRRFLQDYESIHDVRKQVKAMLAHE